MIGRVVRFARQMAKLRGGSKRSRPLRIAYGRIFHEACADSPVLTTREDFLRLHALEGRDLAAVTTLRGSELAGYLPPAELTGFVQVFINGRAIQYLNGLETPVSDSDIISLFPPVGGG